MTAPTPPLRFADPHKTSQKPILINDCAKMLRAAGFAIWSILKIDAGLEVRAESGRKQLKIVVPTPGQQMTQDMPIDRSCNIHVVNDMDTFQTWLTSLNPASVS